MSISQSGFSGTLVLGWGCVWHNRWTLFVVRGAGGARVGDGGKSRDEACSGASSGEAS